MQRDILLLTEMIEAAEQAQELTDGITASDLESDRLRRDALLWNFTVLGEAAGQLSEDVKTRFSEVTWQQPVRLRNRIVHGYWSVDMEILHTAAREQLATFAADLRPFSPTSIRMPDQARREPPPNCAVAADKLTWAHRRQLTRAASGSALAQAQAWSCRRQAPRCSPRGRTLGADASSLPAGQPLIQIWLICAGRLYRRSLRCIGR